MSNCFIILAAGKSNRFISKIPKPYIKYKGDILINHSINKAILSKKFSKIVVAINKGHKKHIKKMSNNKVHYIEGGRSRADSSKICLKYLSKFNPNNVLIHDAARPNFTISLIHRLLKNLKKYDGVVPVLKTSSSIKTIKNKKILNLDRNKIFLSQTPQAFNFKKIFNLQKKINTKTTDDASLFVNNSNRIKMIKGEEKNIKITTKNDIKENLKYYFGIGFDVHRLVKNKKMYLGGLKINSKLGTLGHSDGDPVLHAITDSILGACRKGDIGQKFSDKNSKFKNIRSTILLQEVIKKIKEKGFFVNNIDINIITQTPKIKNLKNKMIKKISKLCEISNSQINIKGKTTEKLGLIGKAPGRYNMYIGGNRAGTRVPKQYLENATTKEILEATDVLIGRWAKEREPKEEFGDFVIRAEIIQEIKCSATDFWG